MWSPLTLLLAEWAERQDYFPSYLVSPNYLGSGFLCRPNFAKCSPELTYYSISFFKPKNERSFYF